MAIDVKVPGVGESVQEGMIASWAKTNGDWISQDDILCSLETDKATVEIVAENSGKLQILIEAGNVVKVGEVIARIDETAQGRPSKKETKEVSPPPSSQTTKPSATNIEPHEKTTGAKENGPAVRRMVAEMGVDLKTVRAHGKDGRTTKGDILASLDKQNQEKIRGERSVNDPSTSLGMTGASLGMTGKASAPAGKTEASPGMTSKIGSRSETREPMSMLRRKIASRLVEAQHTAAILTTFNEVDMSAVIALRNKYKDSFEKRNGVKLGFMGFFLKASVWALQEFPRVNASIDNNEIVYHHYCDIGVAVSTEKGLLVPILRNVEQMSLKEIEQSIGEFSNKARNNKISIEDISGGTFTVSNGGIFGSLLSTPILNPPQTAILGMHKIQQRPVVLEDGRIEARPMMYLAMSYDHRLIDGKEAVQFLVKVKECIEDPSRLLLGV
jgi:2-oxoglutarate dehydrogenase E2 component (dihydrolipoamide succinyltransferase)